jgi:hypothetical protein
MRPRAEEVQVQVGGGDRLVTHPGLDRSRVDAAGEPEARGRVAQVVDAAPVHRAQGWGPMELRAAFGPEEQIAGLLALGHGEHEREHDVIGN